MKNLQLSLVMFEWRGLNVEALTGVNEGGEALVEGYCMEESKRGLEGRS